MKWYDIGHYKFLIGNVHLGTPFDEHAPSEKRVYAIRNADGTQAIGLSSVNINELPKFISVDLGRKLLMSLTDEDWVRINLEIAKEVAIEKQGFTTTDVRFDYGGENKGCCCHDCVHFVPKKRLDAVGMVSIQGSCSNVDAPSFYKEHMADRSIQVHGCSHFKQRKEK